MDQEATRARIRSKIKPFPKIAHYPTGWNGLMTFEDIQNALTPSINRLMRYYRYVGVDIPDMIAHGFMRLWEELSTNPQLLVEMSQGNAVSWVMHRSGNSHYQKFYRREMYLEELATRSGDPDEFIIEGYEGRWYSEHSEYSQRVDLRIDIEKAMEYMAAKYEHSRPHLAALYYITTSISVEDAAALADRPGAKRAWWLTSIVKPMREELTQLLDLFSPRRATWQEKVRVGQKAPLLELIGQYEQSGDKRMAATLLGLAENTSTKDLMEKLSLPKTHVHYLRRIAHKELNQAYGCSA